MEPNRNLGGNSNVQSFEIGDNYIAVVFRGGGRLYRYSHLGGAGRFHMDNMKILAKSGRGLNSYIKTYVDKLYDR